MATSQSLEIFSVPKFRDLIWLWLASLPTDLQSTVSTSWFKRGLLVSWQRSTLVAKKTWKRTWMNQCPTNTRNSNERETQIKRKETKRKGKGKKRKHHFFQLKFPCFVPFFLFSDSLFHTYPLFDQCLLQWSLCFILFYIVLFLCHCSVFYWSMPCPSFSQYFVPFPSWSFEQEREHVAWAWKIDGQNKTLSVYRSPGKCMVAECFCMFLRRKSHHHFTKWRIYRSSSVCLSLFQIFPCDDKELVATLVGCSGWPPTNAACRGQGESPSRHRSWKVGDRWISGGKSGRTGGHVQNIYRHILLHKFFSIAIWDQNQLLLYAR